jgi:hypothetical protein
MWVKFSVALVLAVGVAVKRGPQSLFMEDDDVTMPEAAIEDAPASNADHQPVTERKALSQLTLDDSRDPTPTGFMSSLRHRRLWPAFL